MRDGASILIMFIAWKGRVVAVGAAPEEIRATGQRLIEEPLLLERLSEDDAKQAAVPGVGQGGGDGDRPARPR